MSRHAQPFLAALLLVVGGCAVTADVMPRTEASKAAARDALRVQAPTWSPGEAWRYSDGYGLVVAGVEGQLTTFRRLDDPEQWFQRRGFLKGDAQSSTTLRKLLFENAAPEAGGALTEGEPLTYRREYSANGEVKAHATSWSIEGRERVKVPAGEFDCIMLVMRTRSLNNDWTGFERWWYSPEVRNYVRLEFKYGATTGSRVLLGYEKGTVAQSAEAVARDGSG